MLSMLTTLCLLQAPAAAVDVDVRLHLSQGRQVVGRLVKETAESLFLDVGFDILKIPRQAVLQREAAGEQPEAVVREEIFSRGSHPEESIPEGVRRVEQAVVKIETGSGQGSGFVISEDGYVVTNFHVVAGEVAADVIIYLRSRDGFDVRTVRGAEVVAINPHLDLAMVKMEPPDDVELAIAHIGDSETVETGDRVYAIGAPIGLERTVSAGIVSVTNRSFGGFPHFQITAAVNPGNSGGPLFNLRSQVVGVVNAKMVGVGIEGLNFAIPAKYLVDFLRNRDAFAFDSTRSEHGIHYLPAPPRPPLPTPRGER